MDIGVAESARNRYVGIVLIMIGLGVDLYISSGKDFYGALFSVPGAALYTGGAGLSGAWGLAACGIAILPVLGQSVLLFGIALKEIRGFIKRGQDGRGGDGRNDSGHGDKAAAAAQDSER